MGRQTTPRWRCHVSGRCLLQDTLLLGVLAWRNECRGSSVRSCSPDLLGSLVHPSGTGAALVRLEADGSSPGSSSWTPSTPTRHAGCAETSMVSPSTTSSSRTVSPPRRLPVPPPRLLPGPQCSVKAAPESQVRDLSLNTCALPTHARRPEHSHTPHTCADSRTPCKPPPTTRRAGGLRRILFSAPARPLR